MELAKRKNKNGIIDLFAPFGDPFATLFDRVIPGLNSFTTNLVEEENSYVLTADIPGVSENDIDLTFDNGVLSLSCKQSECRSPDEGYEEGSKTHWQERYYGESTRRFRIEGVDQENITAELSKGVLTVRLSKQETTAPVTKQIEIKTK